MPQLCHVGAVKKTIKSVLDVDRIGGKLICRDDDTIILSDCSRLLHEHIEIILTQHPFVDVQYVSSSTSESGYIVLFTCCMQIPLLQRAVFFEMIFSFLIFVLVCLWSTVRHLESTIH